MFRSFTHFVFVMVTYLFVTLTAHSLVAAFFDALKSEVVTATFDKVVFEMAR